MVWDYVGFGVVGKGVQEGSWGCLVQLEGVQQVFCRSTPLPMFGAF